MDFEKWEMGDPERVVMRREAERMRKDAVCGECAHRSVDRDGRVVCDLPRHRYGAFKCDDFRMSGTIRWEDLCK